MEIAKIVSNPWVIGGGAALALVLVLSRNSSGGEAPSGYSGSGLNASAFAYATAAAQIAADQSGQSTTADTARTLKAYDTLVSLATVNADFQTKMAETNAGIVNAKLVANTALQLDRSQQAERYKEAWLGANVSKTLSANETSLDKYKTLMSTSLAKFISHDANVSALALSKVGAAVQIHQADKQADAAASAASSAFWSNLIGGAFKLGAAIINPASAI